MGEWELEVRGDLVGCLCMYKHRETWRVETLVSHLRQVLQVTKICIPGPRMQTLGEIYTYDKH